MVKLTNASQVSVLLSVNSRFLSIWSFKTFGKIPHFTVQPNMTKTAPVTKIAKEVHLDLQHLPAILKDFDEIKTCGTRYQEIIKRDFIC